MPKRHRLFFVAVGGYVICFLAVLAFQPWELRPSAQHSNAREHADASSTKSDAYYEGRVICERDCQVTFGVNEPAPEESGETKPAQSDGGANAAENDLDPYDLLAQERMAYWAAAMAAFTGFSLLFIAYALIEQLRVNRLIERGQHIEFRPYVNLTGFQFTKVIDAANQKCIAATPLFINGGKTPAVVFATRIQTRVKEKGDSAPPDWSGDPLAETLNYTVAPGVPMDMNARMLNMNTLRDIGEGRKRVFYRFTQKYRGSLLDDTEHETTIAVEVLVSGDPERNIDQAVPVNAWLNLRYLSDAGVQT